MTCFTNSSTCESGSKNQSTYKNSQSKRGRGFKRGYTQKATDLTGEPTSPCAAKRNVATAAKEEEIHYLTLKRTRKGDSVPSSA